MKHVSFLLEEDEIILLRTQARLLELMVPERNELIESFIQKILDGTNDAISPEGRKAVGKIQRALRKVKTTSAYSDFIIAYQEVDRLLNEEMDKEDLGQNPESE